MLAQWSVVVGWTEPGPPFLSPPPSEARENVTVQESVEDEAIVWRVPLQGFRRKDVEVTALGSALRIRAERTKGLLSPTHTRVETSLAIPATVDPLGIEASFDGGILTVRLPKRPEAKRRHIAIRYEGRDVIDVHGEEVVLPETWSGRVASWCAREWRQFRDDARRLFGRA